MDHLPDDIVGRISSFLPIQTAARATLLSRNLTSSWRQNRNICFIRQIIHDDEYIEHINTVMNQHSGPKIDSLVLRLDPTGHEDQIRGWIQIAAAKGVELLDLDFSVAEDITLSISSDLIESEFSEIKTLKLNSCNVQFSEQFNGLRFLKTLHFHNVPLTLLLMSSIMRNCLALETLEITGCSFEFNHVNIMAGLLKHFKKLKIAHFGQNCEILNYSTTIEELSYRGEICSFVFETSMPRLRTVTVLSLESPKFQYIPQIPDFFSAIRYCTSLQICGKLIQGLFADFTANQYRSFHWQPSFLRDLTMHLNGENIVSRGTSFINPCDIAYFLQNCPSLEKLTMDLGEYPMGEGRFWKLEARKRFEMCRPRFYYLKNIFIRGFKYRNLEFQLLRMMVENAPSLRTVTLVQTTAGDSTLDREACLQWMRSQRCSFNEFQ